MVDIVVAPVGWLNCEDDASESEKADPVAVVDVF